MDMAILDMPVPRAADRPEAPAGLLGLRSLRAGELPTWPLGTAHLRVRPLDGTRDGATDGPRLLAMCPHVSQQSIYQRFFTSFHRLPDPLLALLLDVDHDHREALVALDGDDVVAVARYATLQIRPDEADVSILVVDAWQRRGVASRLLQLLDERAAAHGIRTFVATVLLENRQARGLLSRVRPDASARYAEGASTYRFPVRSVRPAHGSDSEAA
jgi:GNAT superfamily N-acetyltransferase